MSLRWSPGLLGLLRSPLLVPAYLCASVGPRALPAPFSTTLSLALSVYLRKHGATRSASGQTACPVGPTLRQSQSRQGHASPLRPSCPTPPLLPVWMNVYFLSPWCWTSRSFDFLSVLVVRGGTGVFTYAVILVLLFQFS